MFYITQDNIKTTKIHVFMPTIIDQPCVFKPAQKVFLCVPHNSKTLSTSKCAKLSP